MSILVDENTRVIVQGITGRDGSFHAKAMLDYGTNVVGGVTPFKGGSDVYGIPVFDTVEEAVRQTNANATVIFVPAKFAEDAIYEAANAGIKLIVTITEGIPVQSMVRVVDYVKKLGLRLIGPNCPGVISVGKAKLGIMPGNIFKKGKVGVVSRSGTLTYEIVKHISDIGLGETTAVGIGGDPIIGMKFIDVLKEFESDPETEAIVLVGEIGGTDEEDAADYIEKHFNKPVVSFIAGRASPKGKRMGHAGAIVTPNTRTAEEKVAYLESKGIRVGKTPVEVAEILREILKNGEK
ncbi:succinate--CoA ligase subunit alpha [Caldisericum exile]|uniref:Succinate--CoA ligase [ADP-forming] subunit alpha n=1 Tax=Caldisericum exile (strain DSM 21853 / NBRC 104410 / AZM16c01) TaxID=511051 RepID=A0A7U6GEY7_CALEA|nr:succinate--CoA ligase subunit alpha [Caldisericum exile]BAL81145.1 succinyl-CoA synthetase alpha subunit [Caldisericum exile AZM16c01]